MGSSHSLPAVPASKDPTGALIYLLKHTRWTGARAPHWEPLLVAEVQRLLSAGANVNAWEGELSPLLACVGTKFSFPRSHITRLLIEAGADVNAVSPKYGVSLYRCHTVAPVWPVICANFRLQASPHGILCYVTMLFLGGNSTAS